MKIKSPSSFEFKAFQERLKIQFMDLDPSDPSSWPTVPKFGLFVVATVVVIIALWFVWLSGSQNDLQDAQAKEITLRDNFKSKLTKAVNLEVLKKQREQVEEYVTQLEKQLPSKSEMENLLSDINQAGLGRSLQFDLFKPGDVAIKDYYAELPVSLRVFGRYNDIGAFASDIANLSRIVTLNNLTIAPRPDGMLVLDSTAKTFRYLDAEEILTQKAAIAAAKKGAAASKKE